MHILFEKRCFWKGPLKRVFTLSVIHKSCALLKTLFYSVFSKIQLLQRIGCKLQKKERTCIKNSGLCFSMQKGGFKPFFFDFFVWFGFCDCYVFLSWRSKKKAISCKFLEFFSLLFPQNPFLQNPSLLLVFLLVNFLFSSLLEFHLSFSPCFHQPLLREHYCLFLLLCLSFLFSCPF